MVLQYISGIMDTVRDFVSKAVIRHFALYLLPAEIAHWHRGDPAIEHE